MKTERRPAGGAQCNQVDNMVMHAADPPRMKDVAEILYSSNLSRHCGELKKYMASIYPMITHKVCTTPRFKHIISEVVVSLFCFEQADLTSLDGLYFMWWLFNWEKENAEEA